MKSNILYLIEDVGKGLNCYLTLCLFFVFNNALCQNSKQFESYISTYFQAKKAENNFDFTRYEQLLDNCIRIDKSQSVAFFSKSQLYFIQKDYNQAIKFCLLSIEKEDGFCDVYYKHLFNCYEHNKAYDDALLVTKKLLENDSSNNYYQLLYLQTLNALNKKKQIEEYVLIHQVEFSEVLIDFALMFYHKNNPLNVEDIHNLYLLKEAKVKDVDVTISNHVRYLIKYNRLDLVYKLFSYQPSMIYETFDGLLRQKGKVYIDYSRLSIAENLVLISILEYVKDHSAISYKNYWLNNVSLIQENELLNKLYSFSILMKYDDLSMEILSFSLNQNPKNLQVIELFSMGLMRQGENNKAYNVVAAGLSYYPYEVNLLLKQLYLSVFVAPKQYPFLLNELELLSLQSNDLLNIKLIKIVYQLVVEKKPSSIFDHFYNNLNKNDKLFIQQEIEKKWFILQSYL